MASIRRSLALPVAVACTAATLYLLSLVVAG